MKMTTPQDFPTEFVWQGLQAGDPGPFVAFFDALMAHDLAHAAGGLLRDIGDRLVDENSLADLEQPETFVEAARKGLLCCLQGDEQDLELLLKEAVEATD